MSDDAIEPKKLPIRATPALRASLILVGVGVLTQIAYPLLSGPALRAATILSVLLLAAASLAHAGAAWGLRGALTVLVVAGGLGLAAETVGVHTGYPFGTYRYADTLGPRLAGVPLLVPLAWTMLAYPCLLLGRRLARHLTRTAATGNPTTGDPTTGNLTAGNATAGNATTRNVTAPLTALIGGAGLAAWDLFLDPQMVAQGHWSWANPQPALPGVPGVPLTNYAGWLLVAVLMIAALDRVLPAGSPAGELTPAAALAWTWAGSAVGNLAFFDRPWVALYGGLAMGAVVLPYLLLQRAETANPAMQNHTDPHNSTGAWA